VSQDNGGTAPAEYARKGNMERLKTKQKLGPSDFAAEIERLKAAGQMPSLERLLEVLGETRAEYAPKILAARRDRRTK